MKSLQIIVPTYNERRNVKPLVEAIAGELEEVDLRYGVTLVDDDSPDRTWAVAESLRSEYPLEVIRRESKKGLSSAVVRGLEETESDYAIVMDADFQHPPSSLPRLVDALLAGHDLVVASRFLPESEITDFGWFRTSLALAANSLARLTLEEVRPVRDALAGYFGFERSVLADRFPEPYGYKILLTLLVHGEYSSLTEVAYTFDRRRAGESKLGLRNVYWFLKQILTLYTSRRRDD